MRHVADTYRSVTLLRAGNCHHRRILVIIVVTAVPEAVSVCLLRLETRAVESLQIAILIRNLGTLHLDGNALPYSPDDVIQQFGVLVNILSLNVVQVLGGFVFHHLNVLFSINGTDRKDRGDLAMPDDRHGGA